MDHGQSQPQHHQPHPQQTLPAVFPPQIQQQQQQPHHHHLPQQQLQQQQQQQQQQQPQDVLAEARKNLQVLIDSGLSRELLHQLVDNSQSLQLAIPPQSSVLQSQQQPQSPQQNLQAQPSHSNSLPSSNIAAYPPPPQCPPPPPPARSRAVDQGSPVQQQQQQSEHVSPPQQSSTQHAVVSPIVNSNTTSPPSNIKTELPSSEVLGTWRPDAAPLHCATNQDAPMMAYHASQGQPSFLHRPRISVSSTSSGSSGHASVFSNMSSQSGISWTSAGSNCARMQAPLPLPPQLSSPTGAPVMNAGPPATLNKHNIYWCTSCETSFKRKYDWKRHEDEFHERWRKYPCPEPGCNRSFWGSNSFNQHHKQCHGCTTCPHAEKVVKFLRKRKYWACGFCSALHPARERHVEHVARHFESGMTKGEWMHSRVIYGLLHQPLIHEAWDALGSSRQSEYGNRRPRFSWHPSKTGRAQGFLEKENAGQLQDLLEFFSGDEAEAQWIASVAYDLADIVMDHVQLTPPHYSAQATMPSYQDPSMSFASVPSHQQLPMLPSSESSGHQQAYSTNFPSSMLVSSQGFPRTAGPSPPDSATQSPLASNHSPITSSSQAGIKQEPHTASSHHGSTHGAEGVDGIMDFEYSPAPVVFEDWESMSGQTMDEPTPNQSGPGTQPGWGMMHYFADPRVA